MDLTKLDELVPQLESMKQEELLQMLKSLEVLLSKTKDCITAKEKPNALKAISVDNTLFQFQHDPGLYDKIVADVSQHLKTLKYHPNTKNPHSPEIYLYGSQRYSYNEQSAALKPTPILPNSVMDKLLEAVNMKLNTSFNSILINKYKDVNCFLGAHKDDEECLDPTAPISTLSLGATRRLQISLDASKHTTAKTFTLTPGSIFTMMPGFQDRYWHAIAAGRKSITTEKGVRYSITFRKLLPCKEEHPPATAPGPVAEPDANQPPEESASTAPAANTATANDAADTFVFGSSLVKGLDEQLLSKYSKKFKVFCNSGAHVKDIYEDVEKLVAGGKHDTTKVSNVFLLCGGNDVENLEKDIDIKFVFEDIEDLVDLTREAFPSAKIHLISLIPRRSKYLNHIRNMHKVNNWLKDFCRIENIRFVDIFSFFLVKSPSIWMLNNKLFNGSKLHFNTIGDSVLAKVLIGVANLPR